MIDESLLIIDAPHWIFILTKRYSNIFIVLRLSYKHLLYD